MQLILVGGAQRSGTTLLQTLLVNALHSPNLPEAHILSDILAAYKRAKEFGNKTGYFYATDGDLRSFFQSFAERHIADIVAKAKPSAVLVLKDPNFIQVPSAGGPWLGGSGRCRSPGIMPCQNANRKLRIRKQLRRWQPPLSRPT